jgi:hypothetical protein
MKKVQIKLDLRAKPVPEKVQFARQIVTDMTGNANFATPNPALETVLTATIKLESAYNDAQTAKDLAKAKTSLQKDAENTLETILNNLGNYVEIIANGNPSIVKSAGMGIRGENVTLVPKFAVKTAAIKAVTGDNEGEMRLSWNSVFNARSYEVQVCLGPIKPEGWTHAGTSTKSQYTVTKLESIKKYWFRVAAITKDGPGPWSDPVAKVTQ